MLHRKPYIEDHLRSAQKRLIARLELLTTRGMDAGDIEKDNQIKRLKAKARKANRELTAITAMETLMTANTESRMRKEAAAKAEPLHKERKKKDGNAPPAKKKKKRPIEADED
jgi:hypothetical protein